MLGHGGSGAQEDGGLCLKTGFAGTSSLHENGVKFVGLDIFLAKLGTASVRPNFPIRVERKLAQLACSTMQTWSVAPFRDNLISTKKTNQTRILHGGELLDGTSPPLTTRPTDCGWGSMTHVGDLGEFGDDFLGRPLCDSSGFAPFGGRPGSTMTATFHGFLRHGAVQPKTNLFDQRCCTHLFRVGKRMLCQMNVCKHS